MAPRLEVGVLVARGMLLVGELASPFPLLLPAPSSATFWILGYLMVRAVSSPLPFAHYLKTERFSPLSNGLEVCGEMYKPRY